MKQNHILINPEWENAQFEVVTITLGGFVFKGDRFRTIEDAENLTNPIPRFIIQTGDKE